MNLATLDDGSRDGRLVVVSADHGRMMTTAWPTLQSALDKWSEAEPALRAAASRLEKGEGEPFDAGRAAAPLPRAYQWLDASAYLNHGRLMQQAFNLPPNDESLPLMYQGGSDDFMGPRQRAAFVSETDGIDFEAEFGVVLDDVPMGVSPRQALGHVRLIVLVNDWSLRALAPREMKAGFGFLQAKPATAFGPLAVTPDALGSGWQDGRLHLRMRVDLNGVRFGDLDAALIDFSFGDLIAFAARTRNLRAGTIIGSGTVSNADRSAGSGCISERRVIEMIDESRAHTRFLKSGDSVRIEAFDASGATVFGRIDQQVVLATTKG